MHRKCITRAITLTSLLRDLFVMNKTKKLESKMNLNAVVKELQLTLKKNLAKLFVYWLRFKINFLRRSCRRSIHISKGLRTPTRIDPYIGETDST